MLKRLAGLLLAGSVQLLAPTAWATQPVREDLWVTNGNVRATFSRVIQGGGQKFWVAWIGAFSATLLLTADAGVTWGAIVRRRTPASRPEQERTTARRDSCFEPEASP